MSYIDQNDLLSSTNGGLDIILSYYPQANDALTTNRKEFKIRDERTPSARMIQLKDGNWVVTDFGDDSIPRNGIQVCMREDSLTYREALVKLADRYGVGSIKPGVNKPERETRDARADEEEKEYYFDIKEGFDDSDLKELSPKVNDKYIVTQAVCKRYNVYALRSYTYIKDRKAYTTFSNENYPIFMIEHDEFKKVYQPRNPEKQYRFLYAGSRPKDYINGLAQVRKEYEKLQADHNPEEGKAPKLPSIVLASGERDSLLVAAFGYNVIWLNSETARLSWRIYRELTKMADMVYNLPDIDSTGIRQAIKLGLEFLDIKIILLPHKLRQYKDNRGKPRKDFRDYVELYPKREDFDKLVRVAMPLRFWDEEYTDNGLRYHFNNEQAYFFLEANGYYQFENKNVKGGMMFIQIDGNIVSQAEPDDARKFMHNFMKERYLPIPLRNTVHRSKQLTEGSLRGLEKTVLDFTDYDKNSQYLFFGDRTWIVTGKDIEEKKPGEVEKYVWKEEVIQHKVRVKDPMFKIEWNSEEEEFDIEILNTDSIFFRFLINTSRIHWRSELEVRIENDDEVDGEYFRKHKFNIAGPRLTDEEVWEQKQHLINKIFSIGYLLHRYKDPGRPWCVFAMDNKNSEMGESHGRSGKSFCYRAIRYFMKSVTLNGRNPKLTENPHVYDRVTEHTDMVLIDDADMYLNFGFFFNALQGDLEVNPKNNKSYEIPFENVPKFCITSNFTLRNIDPSTEGRILYSVFSDYYHIRTDGEDYKEDRSPRDDFGKNLFLDYDEDEWNFDFNFFARSLQFYLSTGKEVKLNPPMDNVNKRNLRTEMTEAFKNWADVYFDLGGHHCNALIVRDNVFKDFKDKTSLHKWTTNKFTKALKAWARYTEYVHEMDPAELRNSQGRIIRKHEGEVAEMIYVKTRDNIEPNLFTTNETEDPFTETGDKPF